MLVFVCVLFKYQQKLFMYYFLCYFSYLYFGLLEKGYLCSHNCLRLNLLNEKRKWIFLKSVVTRPTFYFMIKVQYLWKDFCVFPSLKWFLCVCFSALEKWELVNRHSSSSSFGNWKSSEFSFSTIRVFLLHLPLHNTI